MKKFLFAIGVSLLITAVSLFVIACGGENAQEEKIPSSNVRIEMGEFYFAPNVIRMREGQEITIKLVNHGKVAHEFMAGRKVEMHEGVPEGYEHDFFAGIDMHELMFTGTNAELERKEGHGTEVMVESGGSATLTFKVPADTAGNWEFACFVPGHYEAGQKGTFIVIT